MAFNHNTKWEAGALSKSLREYGDDLLRALRRVRQTPEEKRRPIIFIGHGFGGLIIKQNEALVIAGGDNTDDFCNIHKLIKGFVFLGTPHKGAQLTTVGKMISLFGHWQGSSTSLLEITEPKSIINRELHESFMQFLGRSCGTADTVCAFEAVKESLFGFPIMHVVEKDSAVIDGSRKIGLEQRHRDVQRFVSRNDENYQDVLWWIRRWVEKLKERTSARQMEVMKEKTQEQQECLQSLAFPEMDERGNDIESEASETCAWILTHKNYTTWLGQHRGLLWIKGKPGAGKSTLLKYALRKGKQRAPLNKLIVASFFFHGRGAPIQKSPLGLFRSLLHQILDQVPNLLSEFSSIFKERCKTKGEPGRKWEWHVAELQEFLETFILRISRAYSIRIYVDALDECGDVVAKHLVTYFQRLVLKLGSTEATLNICFSCRHYPILTLEHGLIICVEDENHLDIATYVKGELERGFSDKDKARELKEKIVDKASGVFQWAVLVIPKVLELHWEGKSMTAIQTTIQEIPPELSELYQDILERLKDRSQSLQLMQWISFAQRPLSLEELRFAMAVDADVPYSSLTECQKSEAYVETKEDMEKRVKSLSGGLAEVKERQSRQVAQFIHRSVKDYLLQRGLQQLESSPMDGVIGRAHFRLSRSCIKYMTMEEVLRNSCKVRHDLERKFPLLRYATTNWVSHVEIVETQRISQGDLLGLLQWPSNQILRSWTHIYEIMGHYSDRLPAANTTLLHIASRYGLLSVITAVLKSEDSVEVDSKDSHGRTPLWWASRNGHKPVVKLLLDTEKVDVDSKDNNSRTPLLRAAVNGQEAVMKLLLDTGKVDVDSKDNGGRTPLSWAALNGHEAVVKLLLDTRKVDVDSKDNNGRTPLLRAAVNGHEAIVKLLLDTEKVDANSKDNNGWTPLLRAAVNGHEAVVKLLLDTEKVDVDSKDNGGRTPLSWAIENRQEAVVKLLLDTGKVDVDSKDDDGRTPLSRATEKGCWAMVKPLDTRKVDVDSKGNGGRTPLSRATERRHEAV
ncbi:hypothetical protein FGG08_005333 [Glutinoglossum americanum]|uniref:Uncharacterized protein n=1 Tax=Glutinoglossum americanum TaxID=1670608 RepID=A0A9P8HYG1_9PEZI|nr:hypothetical protein FGG08_005333 [Glutinoglossum americanum]